MVKKQSHKMAVNKSALVRRVAGIGTPHTAVMQGIANSCDARAKNIWITWDKAEKTVAIIDDGFGIVGEIPDNDFETLGGFDWQSDEFTVNINANDHPLVLFEKPTSTISMWYMMMAAGFSVKNHLPTWMKIQNILTEAGWNESRAKYVLPQGVYGVGFLETMGVAQRVRIESRVCQPLAEYHYGKTFKHQKSVPAFVLNPPTLEDTTLSFGIDPLPKLLVPYGHGREMDHGTVVWLEGVEGNLRLEHLKMEIAQHFGMLILSGQVVIHVGEVIRDKRKTGPNAVSVSYAMITATRLTGKPLMLRDQETIEMRIGDCIARVKLYHVGKDGQITSPVFVRREVPGDPVTALPGLFDGAWEDTRLTGYVHILTPVDVAIERDEVLTSSDEAYWNTQKTYPNLRDRDMRQLVEMVAELEPEIAERIKQMDDEKREERISSFADVVSKSLSEVSAAFGDFFELDTMSSNRGSSSVGRKTKQAMTKESLDIRVLILNEHNERVGVDFRFGMMLMNHREKEIVTHQFKGSGTSFKRPGRGSKFAVQIELPKGVKLAAGQSAIQWMDLVDDRGQLVIFSVITGEPKRRRETINSQTDIQIRLRSLGADGPIWDTELTLSRGVVIFNIDYPFFDSAYREDDIKTAAHIIAEGVADAISFVAYGDRTDATILMQTQRLANRLAQGIIKGWRKQPKR